MSAKRILPTGEANIVAVFVCGFFYNRAACSCSWEGPVRMLSGWATLDAYAHVGHCRGCYPSRPLLVDRRAHSGAFRRAWRWLTPPVVIAALPLLLIPAGLWLAPAVHAEPLDEFARQVQQRVCLVIDDSPTPYRVEAVLSLLRDDGLTTTEADSTVWSAVAYRCPRNTDVVREYYAQRGQR